MAKLKQIIQSKLSYTSQDYDAILKDIISLFSGEGDKIATDWDNLTETDPLFIFFNILAAHKDILNYMLEYRVLEGYLSTAKEFASVIRKISSYGYKPKSYKSGMAEYKVDKNITIPFGEQFVDANGIPYVYFDEEKEYVIEEKLNLYQGSIVQRNINIEMIKDSDLNKTFVLDSNTVAIGSSYQNKPLSKLVCTDDGQEFLEVESLYRYNGLDYNVYELNVDPQGLTYMKFHKDIDLSTYNGTHNFILYYVSTRGKIEELPLSTLNKIINSVDVTLSFTGKYFVGESPATKEEIVEDFKYYYASSNLLITLDDFKNYIINLQKEVQNINRCLVIDKQLDTTGKVGRGNNIPLGEVNIFVIKEDNVSLDSEEITSLLASVGSKSKTLAGIKIIIKNAVERKFKVILGYSTASEALKTFVEDYINNLPIGEDVVAGKINRLIIESPFREEFILNSGSVSFLEDSATIKVVELDYNQFPSVEGFIV